MKHLHLAIALTAILFAAAPLSMARADTEAPCPKEGGCLESTATAVAPEAQPAAESPVAAPKAVTSNGRRARLPICDLGDTGTPLWQIGGDGAGAAKSVFVLGFSPSGRLGWLEQRAGAPDGPVEWTVHVTALTNGRAVATQTYRSARGGVGSICARHAREVAQLLGANGVEINGTVALKQPAIDGDPTAVELRAARFEEGSGSRGFDLVLRGSAGSKVIGILPQSDGAAPPAVLGFIRSPFERRVAIPVTEEAASKRGRTETRLQFYGGRLDRGWTPDESRSDPSRSDESHSDPSRTDEAQP